MDVSPESEDLLICPYCGAQELIEESDAVKIEKMRRDVALRQQSILERNLKRGRNKENAQSIRRILVLVIRIILLVFFFILSLAAFSLGWYASGVIALIQIGLILAAFVIDYKKIRGKLTGLSTVLVVVAVLLFLPFVLLSEGSERSSGVSQKTEEFNWDDLEMGSKLPKPESTLGRVSTDSGERLRVEIDPYTLTQFKAYVKACREAGYTVDVLMPYERDFEAYNEEGYHLELYHYDSRNYMMVYLDAPIQMSSFLWPSHGLANLVPAPQSGVGKIVSDSADYFQVYIGETSLSDYSAYVSGCIEAGFSEEYYQYDRSFSGKNADGVRLSIDYEGFQTMYLRMSKPYD